MAYQATFKRYELKYLLTRQEKQNVLKSMAEHMKLDDYGRQPYEIFISIQTHTG